MKMALRHVIHCGSILTSVALVVLTVCYFRNTRRIEHLENVNRQLAEQLRGAIGELTAAVTNSGQTDDLSDDRPTRPIEFFSWEIEAMKRAGLKDPLNDIISDLKQHRELIPYQGSMGGTMGFYGRSKIWILTKKWVLAYFEDGHYGGYLLLEFEITKDGKINWKALASYLA